MEMKLFDQQKCIYRFIAAERGFSGRSGFCFNLQPKSQPKSIYTFLPFYFFELSPPLFGGVGGGLLTFF